MITHFFPDSNFFNINYTLKKENLLPGGDENIAQQDVEKVILFVK
jgi:hypothetical protein